MKYVAFLRGINVGGHHKVPMVELKKELVSMGFTKPITLLNSGNIIFESEQNSLGKLEGLLEEHLQNRFDFKIPTILRTEESILELKESKPFEEIELHKDLRLYITFFKSTPDRRMEVPWESEDGSFRILAESETCLLSVLDVSVSKTVKAMKVIEDFYGKEVTTRNWKTILKISAKLEA